MASRILCPLVAAFATFSAVTSVPLEAQTGQNPIAVTRITEPIDESSLVTLHGNVHPMARPQYDQGPAPASMSTGRILLMLQAQCRAKAGAR